eukprot:6192530-Pleurochrysis_carterae.AAC.1
MIVWVGVHTRTCRAVRERAPRLRKRRGRACRSEADRSRLDRETTLLLVLARVGVPGESRQGLGLARKQRLGGELGVGTAVKYESARRRKAVYTASAGRMRLSGQRTRRA